MYRAGESWFFAALTLFLLVPEYGASASKIGFLAVVAAMPGHTTVSIQSNKTVNTLSFQGRLIKAGEAFDVQIIE
ncbi:hypothetical protein PoB_006664100 [Plakobranchus ocellatus]|uniref:Uncharacterized protein n=1 Tax=Plakobranchus ocellatus TaxID=259542 RepID=A0AAV4D7K3_9GAST|nr:hypothetical protein PoB_006664100 [Plakobranchus ocellatus]